MWLYRHGYITAGMSFLLYTGVCVCLVVLGILPCGAICLCRVNKAVMNTAGFGLG